MQAALKAVKHKISQDCIIVQCALLLLPSIMQLEDYALPMLDISA
jgi:hypothetical protein